MDRSNDELNRYIEHQIFLWRDTLHGTILRNMYVGDADYEGICEAMDVDYYDFLKAQD